MEENQEFTLIDEGQQLEKPATKPLPEQQAKQESGLTMRLIEVRANSKVCAQKAIQLLVLLTPEVGMQRVGEKISPEAARSQLEALAKEENIPPAEFIPRSRQALQTLTLLSDQTISEQRTLEEQISSHQKMYGKLTRGLDNSIK